LANLLTHPLVVPLISYFYASPFVLLWARVRLSCLIKGRKPQAPIAPSDAVAAALLDKKYGVHKYLQANGLRFHYVEKGSPSAQAPLVLFLHGRWKEEGSVKSGGGGDEGILGFGTYDPPALPPSLPPSLLPLIQAFLSSGTRGATSCSSWARMAFTPWPWTCGGMGGLKSRQVGLGGREEGRDGK
jgi:hypothetical protein